jgi:hypothetical protein
MPCRWVTDISKVIHLGIFFVNQIDAQPLVCY